MGKYVGIAAAAGLIAYIGFGLGAVDFFFFFPPQAEVAGSSSLAGEPAAVPLLDIPIPYSATVRQSGDGIAKPVTRFYVAKSVREAQ